MNSLATPSYLQSLGLVHAPFPVTPDQDGFFFSPGLTQQFAELCHFIELRKGFMLVTGDVGVGKSTLARLLLTKLEADGVRTALVFNTFLQGSDLLRAIIRDFDIPVGEDDLEARLQALNIWLLKQHTAGHNCVLILDDAQALDVASLELVRQLSNLETSSTKLLQIVMVAQPEIDDTLARYDLRQLASRLALRLELRPLSLEETDHYLHHRLERAGNAQALSIDTGALKLLHRLSQGYIRRLHLLMDRCLFGLAARNQKRVTKTLMQQAASELGLLKNSVAGGQSRRLGVLMILLCAAVTAYAWQALLPAPTVIETKTVEAAPIISHPVNREWKRFLAAYPDLSWSAALPVDWQDISQVRQLEHNWLPVHLANDLLMSCQNQPSYPLREGRLAFFQTELPTSQIAFGTASQSIVLLQQALAAIGLLEASHIDGQMGPLTAAALARFQQQQQLLASGQPNLTSAYRLTCLTMEGLEDV